MKTEGRTKKPHRFTLLLGSLTLMVAGCAAAPTRADHPRPGLELFVSAEGNFALSRPHAWQVSERASDGRQYIRVAEPADAAWVEVLHGSLTDGATADDVLDQVAGAWRTRATDLELLPSGSGADGERLAVAARFTDPRLGSRRARAWASVHDQRLYLAVCEADATEYDAWRETLLSVVVNVRPLRGAEIANSTTAPPTLALEGHRLSDGSASFAVPRGWSCQEFGRSFFWCQEGAGGAGRAPRQPGTDLRRDAGVVRDRPGMGSRLRRRRRPAAR